VSKKGLKSWVSGRSRSGSRLRARARTRARARARAWGEARARTRLMAAAGICVLVAAGLLCTAGAGCRRGDEAAGVGAEAVDVSLKAHSLPGGVEMVLTVTNQSQEPVEFTFSSGMHHDFVIERQGREVWRWSAGRMFTQAVTTETLEPAGRLIYRDVWGLKDSEGRKVEPGEYEVRARFCGRWDRGRADRWAGPVTVTVGG